MIVAAAFVRFASVVTVFVVVVVVAVELVGLFEKNSVVVAVVARVTMIVDSTVKKIAMTLFSFGKHLVVAAVAVSRDPVAVEKVKQVGCH